jgi:hypothetical protein
MVNLGQILLYGGLSVHGHFACSMTFEISSVVWDKNS